MSNVGFKTSWMKDEGISSAEKISTNVKGDVQITSAHFELMTRIKMTESVIMGKNFSKFEDEKKAAFLDELKWLTALNAQLGSNI